MKEGRLLSIMGLCGVMIWSLIFVMISCSKNQSENAKNLAQKALLATVDNPESIEIIAISQPDSIFGREYITQEEKMNLGMALIKVNQKVMQATNNLQDFDSPDADVSSLMQRQMAAASALRTLTPSGLKMPKGSQEFSGWKIKVEYKGISSNGISYHSEFWCFMDEDAQCVLNSFEIPII